MSLAELLATALRPAACLACGVPAAWPCCARCLPPEPAGAGPWRLAADPGVTLWALGPYRDALRAAVLAGKLRGQPAALTALGRRLGATMAAAGAGADLVTFVAAGRVAGTPRDHAERVAEGVAAALDLPLGRLLAASGGRDLGRARLAGQAGAARPAPRARRRLAGGRVLVVDDLATTGGTLAAAAATLRAAGARQVEAAVLGAAPTALGPPGSRAPPAPAGGSRASVPARHRPTAPGARDLPTAGRAPEPSTAVRPARPRPPPRRRQPDGPGAGRAASRRPAGRPARAGPPGSIGLGGASRRAGLTGVLPAHGGRIVWL